MSYKTYGAVCESDVGLIEHSLDLLCRKYLNGVFGEKLVLAEIGVETCETARSIVKYIEDYCIKDYEYYCIDKSLIMAPFKEARMIYGDSAETWTQFDPKKKIHWLFIDGCHCVNHPMLDFLNWGDFVQTGGYTLFHDSVPDHVIHEHYYSGHGPKDSKLFYVGVREGLRRLGLLDNIRKDWVLVEERFPEGIDRGLGVSLFEKVSWQK